MNRWMLAIIIVAVVLVGGLVTPFAYEKAYTMPGDLKIFKDELGSISNTSTMDAEIAGLEKTADTIENAQSLKLISSSERKKIADNIRNDPAIGSSKSNFEEFKQNATKNQEIALKYDDIYNGLLMGGLTGEIRGIYNTEMESTLEKANNIMNKLPQDYEKGDNKAVAGDLRELANTGREVKTQSEGSAARLQKVIDRLEAKTPNDPFLIEVGNLVFPGYFLHQTGVDNNIKTIEVMLKDLIK